MFLSGWAVALAALGTVPAALTQSRAVAWMWVLGVVALTMLDAALAPRPAGLGVRRETPASVRLTEPTTAHLVVANVGRRRLRGWVRDAWQPSAGATQTRHSFVLRTGESATFDTPLFPTRRGERHAGPVTVRTMGPLRLAGRQRSFAVPAQVRVLPEFASRKHLPSRLRRLREIDGRTAVRLKGAGAEFDSMREYVIGDDVRSIDWRTSARRGDVVVKTFRPERDRRVLIVLDTARLSAARVGDAPRLDASIEGALLLAALASRAGDRVQVTAFDRSERARAAANGPQIMPVLAQALATVESTLLEPDWPATVRLVHSRVSQRALVVLLTTVDAAAIDSGLIEAVAALQRRHQVLVGSVEDPELVAMLAARGDMVAAYGAGAAARSLVEREAVAMRLRQLGAEVVLAAPDDLAPAVCDRYLALKAAGRL